jgi:hypothetical protein
MADQIVITEKTSQAKDVGARRPPEASESGCQSRSATRCAGNSSQQHKRRIRIDFRGAEAALAIGDDHRSGLFR